MSNQKIEKLLTKVINEDVIEFKNSLSKILYEKVNHKLRKEYVRISQNLFENATMSTGVVGSPDSRYIDNFSQTQQTPFANQTLSSQPDNNNNVMMAEPTPSFEAVPGNWDSYTQQQQLDFLFEWMQWYSRLSKEDKEKYDSSGAGRWWIRKANQIVW